MGIINRRNAVLGWSVWQIAKTGRQAQGEGGRRERAHAGLKKGGAIASDSRRGRRRALVLAQEV